MNIIPFNAWSRKRINKGMKDCTSRHKRYPADPRVKVILPKLPWGIIREYLWKREGAVSREELQAVIEDIYNRIVPDTEMFYVHFGDFKVGGA